jgi:predicted thioesterase
MKTTFAGSREAGRVGTIDRVGSSATRLGNVMKQTPRIGLSGEQVIKVGPENRISFVDARMHAVLATPWLIAHLEYAARDALASCLEDHERSVGTAVEVEHLAPAPEGFTVTCKARVIHVSGPRSDLPGRGSRRHRSDRPRHPQEARHRRRPLPSPRPVQATERRGLSHVCRGNARGSRPDAAHKILGRRTCIPLSLSLEPLQSCQSTECAESVGADDPLAAPPIATGGASSRIAHEATAEVGFGFTPLVLLRALKPLFTMPLRRSNNTLRISTVALFWRLFLCRVDPIASGAESLTPSSTRSTANIIRGFESFSNLRTTAPIPRQGDHSKSILPIPSLS